MVRVMNMVRVVKTVRVVKMVRVGEMVRVVKMVLEVRVVRVRNCRRSERSRNRWKKVHGHNKVWDNQPLAWR